MPLYAKFNDLINAAVVVFQVENDLLTYLLTEKGSAILV